MNKCIDLTLYSYFLYSQELMSIWKEERWSDWQLFGKSVCSHSVYRYFELYIQYAQKLDRDAILEVFVKILFKNRLKA